MWQPLRQDKLLDMIDNAEWMMEPPVRALWDRIKVAPRKWQHSPWGDDGGGFWVVAVVGQQCVYYNDIEEGFNTSPYDHWGYIQEYNCNQPDLLQFFNEYHSTFTDAVTLNSPRP